MMNSSNESKQAIKELESNRLWSYFYDLTQIPRESGNEGEVRQYLINFAQERNFWHHVDSTGNLIMRAPATKGMESLPSLALQGHMDMVCVKDEGVEHNFETDPLTLVRDGDWLKAKGTSLGADNGVAIALILDLFSDESAQHGPLEAIITVSEETGLEGAFGLDPTYIESRKMLNLDSEEEGVFYIGCAGGVETNVTLSRNVIPIKSNATLWDISVEGLLGGHSGAEISAQRANAIKVVSRVLRKVADQIEFQIVSFEGGTKRNVIPSTAIATIAISKEFSEKLSSIVKEVEKELQKEFAHSDSNLTLICQPSLSKEESASSPECSKDLINALILAPHGVERMSEVIKGMVETSSNLASIRTSEKSFAIISSHRSALSCSRDWVANKALIAFERAKGEGSLENPYPAWTPNPDSLLAKQSAKVWEETTGTKATITAIHAGLECGIINSLVEGMDSVSFGPNMRDVHSTKERLSISSTEHIAHFLRELVKNIA